LRAARAILMSGSLAHTLAKQGDAVSWLVSEAFGLHQEALTRGIARRMTQGAVGSMLRGGG
jgi:hypothetical protein